MKPIAYLSLLLLTACASLNNLLQPELPLFSPADFGHNIQATQVLTSQQGDNEISMLSSWAVQDNTLTFIGLTANGQELMRILYDGFEIDAHFSPVIEEAPSARHILAQIQFAYWPADIIKERLKQTDWSFSELGGKRILYYYSAPVFQADFIGTKTPISDVNILVERQKIKLAVRTITSELLDK